MEIHETMYCTSSVSTHTFHGDTAQCKKPTRKSSVESSFLGLSAETHVWLRLTAALTVLFLRLSTTWSISADNRIWFDSLLRNRTTKWCCKSTETCPLQAITSFCGTKVKIVQVWMLKREPTWNQTIAKQHSHLSVDKLVCSSCNGQNRIKISNESGHMHSMRCFGNSLQPS